MRVLPDVVGSGPPARGRAGARARARNRAAARARARNRAAARGRACRLLAVGTAIAAAVVLAGCSRIDAALGQRQAIVTFTSSATLAQRLAVRTACAKTPNVTPQPLPSNMNAPYALEQVIYQIDHASDADVALLEKCLAKFPSVVGINLTDSADNGN